MKNFFSVNIICLLAMLGMAGELFSQSATNVTIAEPKRVTGFIENKGQVHDQDNQLNGNVKYLYCSPGFNVQLRASGFSYDTYSETSGETMAPQSGGKSKLPVLPPVRNYHRVDIELMGGNPSPKILATGKSEAFMNYITDIETGKRINDVHDYQQVLYKNIYPNIDLEFHLQAANATGTKVEYDFIVHPGGDASLIKLKYKGANQVGLEGAHLKVEVATGVFNEAIPQSYLKDTHEEITVSYKKSGENTFSFSVSKKYYACDLIIDPMPNLLWCTYYGGSSQDGTGAISDQYLNGGIALDGNSNVYATGYTQSTSQIATSGAYQSTLSATQDAFLAKFNSTGSTLLWGTYIEGPGCFGAGGTGVACDPSGNVYVTGFTDGFGSDFIAKFSSSGSYAWSTTIGGPGNFVYGGPGIAIDANGNVYITGNEGSGGGGCSASIVEQAVIAKYNTSGTQQWLKTFGPLTYSPPDVTTNGIALALDASGNIYVTGYTSSATGIATSGTYQPTYTASYGDQGGAAFVAMFDNNGNQQWGTYYAGMTSCCSGGYNNEGAAIALDSSGIYITGLTSDNTGVATSGSYKTTFSGTQGSNENIYVAKFSYTGGLDWGTYYGGAGGAYADAGMGIATDGIGNVYVTGATTTSTNIASSNTFQDSLIGGVNVPNAFLANFNSSNGTLTWGTYFHGTSGGSTSGTGIAQNGTGKLYIVGETTDTSGFSTSGVWQATFGGIKDAFIACFSAGAAKLSASVSLVQPACNGETNDTATVTPSGGTPPYSYLWSPGGQTTATVTGLSAGTYTVKVSDSTNTFVVDTVKIIQPPALTATVSPNTTICSGQNTTLTASASGGTPGYTYKWSPGTGLNTTTDSSVTASPALTTTYSVTVTDANSCQALPKTVTVTVDFHPLLGTLFSFPDTLCSGDSAQLITIDSHYGTFQWQYSTDGSSFMVIAGDSDTGYNTSSLFQTAYYRAVSSNNCGTDTSQVITVFVTPLPVPVIYTSDSIICSSDSALIQTPQSYVSYLWNNSGTLYYTYANAAGGYWVTVTDTNGCSAISNHVNIAVYTVGPVSILEKDDTLSSYNGVGYQWYRDSVAIPSATSSVYIVQQTGYYAVQVTDSNGCSSSSSQIYVVVTGIEDIHINNPVLAYPNPSSGMVYISMANGQPISKVRVFNIMGQEVSNRVILQNNGNRFEINIQNLPPGAYELRISDNEKYYTTTLLKFEKQ